MKNRKRRPGTAEQLRFYNKQKWDNTPKNPAAALLRSQTFTDYCLKKQLCYTVVNVTLSQHVTPCVCEMLLPSNSK